MHLAPDIARTPSPNPILQRFDLDALSAGAGRIAKPAAPPRFDAGDLYGTGGPTARDIKQDSLGDCYFVATLGALANARPVVIRDAISYNPQTGNHRVTLFQGGREVTVTVTQRILRTICPATAAARSTIPVRTARSGRR